MPRRSPDAAIAPEETIRQALEGAMVGQWGRENAARALLTLVAERDALNVVAEAARRLYNSGEYSDERLWPQLGHALDSLDGTRKLRAES